MNKLFTTNKGKINIEDVVFTNAQQELIDNFFKEYEHEEILSSYKLPVTNKLLLYGDSGCGKTYTAKAIANKLKKRIRVINLGTIVSSKLGETSQNVAAAFQSVENNDSVIFFDEFDSLGKSRDYDDKDNSEMKRVVNTILQLMDSIPTSSVVIAATNQLGLIDSALIRRFDMKMEFNNPNDELLSKYYDNLLSKYPEEYNNIIRKYNISFAEAQNIVFTGVKNNIIKSEIKKQEKLECSLVD